jgi:small-conductance mechanosensitive channel
MSHPMFSFANSEFVRVSATLLTLVGTIVAVKFLQKRASAHAGTGAEYTRHRGKFVLAKNLVLCCAVLLLGGIWGTKIAGGALSLAAVAGALLIVSKEFLGNLIGAGMFAISRPFRVGDVVEVDGFTGRVLDTDMLSTTLVEIGLCHGVTGTTISIPNSLLVVKPVRNLSATGEYTIETLSVTTYSIREVAAMKAALLQAAQEICMDWIETADLHLKRIGSKELMELPSAEPVVMIDMRDCRLPRLVLFYPCRPHLRAHVEQAILDRYLVLIPAPEAPVEVGI